LRLISLPDGFQKRERFAWAGVELLDFIVSHWWDEERVSAH
jgi:hypothetical protein